MAVNVRRILPLATLAAAGCFPPSARICLTPPYDAPAGFSETYHAALAAREPILQPGDAPLPPEVGVGITYGTPYFGLPRGAAPAEPPLDW